MEGDVIIVHLKLLHKPSPGMTNDSHAIISQRIEQWSPIIWSQNFVPSEGVSEVHKIIKLFITVPWLFSDGCKEHVAIHTKK
jgi:hypothetical protein